MTNGNNDSQGAGGLYRAATGWDACTGLGSPKGAPLLKALGPTPPTPHPTGGTGGTGVPTLLEFPPLPPPEPAPAPAPAAGLIGSLTSGSNAVALVGVVGLAAVMGMVAAAGIVATVAISKDKQ